MRDFQPLLLPDPENLILTDFEAFNPQKVCDFAVAIPTIKTSQLYRSGSYLLVQRVWMRKIAKSCPRNPYQRTSLSLTSSADTVPIRPICP